ncbi:MAG TPA: tyrosine-type recombinase/integrase [Puia sp.]|nr:tyrosine-type recombinase/integrase [Puia sp.]
MKKAINRELHFLTEFQHFIIASKKGKRIKKDGTKINMGSIKKLESTYHLLQDFMLNKNFQLRIKILQKNVREISVEKNYWKRFYRIFTDYLYDDLGCFDNYVGSVIKDIRTFFNYLTKDRNLTIGSFHQNFYIRKENIQILTLQPEQLESLIHTTVFDNNSRKTMLKVRDVFVAGCSVALRYSDLINLNRSNLQVYNGQYYLVTQSKKTNIYTQIKLPEYVVKIFKQHSQKKNRLLPYFNLAQLDKHLKKLAEQMGWVQEVVKTRQKRGKAIVIYKDVKTMTNYRFCDLVSSHTMRRTAITTMLRLGMPEHLVRKISGHAPNSIEFHKYVSVAQNYLDLETDKMFAKLEITG